ncbi:MAG TPA: winged helix-turn-helix domain-containing protein [Stellaceae bacterium]|jgi:DNA-binding winged helix-turn-helix (wHTH) protein|nr:winged helix-turn-helix domain-containing protein [Stellaceae bacterium]
MDLVSETPAIIEFGRFRIVPHRRELLANGLPIKLGGRAFEVLMALIEARGTVLGKDALMARVWPNRVVEEKNLHAQISALRTALGAERELIRTVPGHGYQFTGEIHVLADEHAGSDAATTEPGSALPPTNLPAPVSELIGRDAELEEILGLTAAHRLVTLTGAGGIGKTSLGLAVARQLLPKFADGVWVIELAPMWDPDLVAVAVATALGLDLADEFVSPGSQRLAARRQHARCRIGAEQCLGHAERVANALASKQLLLLLDNCEHLVGAAARTRYCQRFLARLWGVANRRIFQNAHNVTFAW